MDKIIANVIILKEVADELGLPLKDVKEIVATQSDFTKLIIESGSWDNVRWPYLGVFKCKTKELMMINYLKGLDPIQAEQFKKAVRTGKIKLQPE
jgi:hypothetical protein